MDLLYEDQELASGTAFFYATAGQNWLVTAKHNLTGKHADTGTPLRGDCGLPDRIRIHEAVAAPHSAVACHIGRQSNVFPLYSGTDKRIANWFCHSVPAVDVAGIKIAKDEHSWQIEANNSVELGTVDFRATAGYDTFVLGYPQGYSSAAGFPIWKRATIASEPELETDPLFLIDTATREGMSGSPVFAKDIGIVIPAGVPDKGAFTGAELIGEAFKFVGIYTGRPLADSKAMLAQLGKVFSLRAIEELVAQPSSGESPF